MRFPRREGIQPHNGHRTLNDMRYPRENHRPIARIRKNSQINPLPLRQSIKRGAHQGVQGIRTLLMGAALTVTLGGCGYLGTLTPKEETDFLPSSASAKTKPVEAAPVDVRHERPLGHQQQSLV